MAFYQQQKKNVQTRLGFDKAKCITLTFFRWLTMTIMMMKIQLLPIFSVHQKSINEIKRLLLQFLLASLLLLWPQTAVCVYANTILRREPRWAPREWNGSIIFTNRVPKSFNGSSSSSSDSLSLSLSAFGTRKTYFISNWHKRARAYMQRKFFISSWIWSKKKEVIIIVRRSDAALAMMKWRN